MQKSNQFFATAKPLRLFFLVAIPGMISMVASSLYNIIEGIFIGQILGETAFAAINIAFPFVMINFSLADLVGVGASVPISISLGQKEEQRANNYFTCALILIFLAGVFMGVLLYFGSPILVGLMGAKGALAELSVKYVRVFALMGPVTTVVFAMDNFLRICGMVKGSMYLNIFMACLTTGLLALFLGVFQWDVDGAGLASSLSMAVCALLALIPFLRKKTVLKFVKPRFSAGMLRQIVACGTPVFLNNIAGRVASIVMNTALLRVGQQTAVAAYSVLMYAGEIVQFLLYGMNDSVQPAIGYNWGARSLDRVKGIAKCAFSASAIVSFLGAAVLMLFPEPICSLFIQPEETALMAMSVRAMRLFGTVYLLRWFGFCTQSFCSAIEKPLPASLLSVCNAMVLPIVFVYLLAPLGLDGLWLNQTATAVLITVLAYFLLRRCQKQMKAAL